MTNKELDKIAEVFLDNFKEVLNVTIINRTTVVVLRDGTSGSTVKKPGEVNLPYQAMKIAYYRAKENQILDTL